VTRLRVAQIPSVPSLHLVAFQTLGFLTPNEPQKKHALSMQGGIAAAPPVRGDK
jgi:hypothetical protein